MVFYDWAEYYEKLYRQAQRENVTQLSKIAEKQERIAQLRGTLLGRTLTKALAMRDKRNAKAAGAAAAAVSETQTPDVRIYNLTHPYACWIKNREKLIGARLEAFANLPKAEAALFSAGHDFVYLSAQPGKWDANAQQLIAEALLENPDADMLYADEDYLTTEGPALPWFKPDYSPETLLSYLYFGNAIIISRRLLGRLGNIGNAILTKADSEPGSMLTLAVPVLYDLVLRAAETLGGGEVVHIAEVLYHTEFDGNEEQLARLLEDDSAEGYAYSMPGSDSKSLQVRLAAAARRGLPAKAVGGPIPGLWHIGFEVPAGTRISVVIPSKDHPELLQKCVAALRGSILRRKAVTGHAPKLEIIVVDNGSDAENKAAYEKLSAEYEFYYLYIQKPFNFSAMCNLGIAHATGELVLLLNDDTEICHYDTLELMAGYALLPEIGAVGPKMLYAETDLIQHAGVTILANGPSHKLATYPDYRNYYHGINRVDRNTLAVTAACLMVERSKLALLTKKQDRYLNEDLRVAYNDVDLCMRLAEAGYRNVLLNATLLEHAESISRGSDATDDAKWERLSEEREQLRALHPAYVSSDPYYNPNLISNALEYRCDYKYPWEDADWRSSRWEEDGGEPSESGSVNLVVEEAKLRKATAPGERDAWVIRGWAYAQGRDNRYLAKHILLKGSEERIYTAAEQLRPDVAASFPAEQNLELAGFYACLDPELLAGEKWQIGIRIAGRTAWTDVTIGDK